MTKIFNPLGRMMERRNFLKVAGASVAAAALPAFPALSQDKVKVVLWSWVPEAVARKVAEHVEDALVRGASALTGGRAPDNARSPLYFEPTVLTGVTRDALINTEETFGPVAPLLRFDSDEEAFALARDNRYGLVSSVFTQDIDRAFRYVEEMPTGTVNINDTSNYWELHIPFGGASGKDSGIGRVGGRHALTAMCDLKTATFTVR